MSATGELTGCPRSACPGSIRRTGYCNTCGMAPLPAPSPPPQESSERSERTSSRQVDMDRLVSRPTTQPVRLHRSQVGAGVVYVAPQRELDPDEMVTPVPSIPENRRFCSSCSQPVGRSHDGRPGRVRGYCSNCREPFDFTKGRARGRPSLEPGDLVAGQYQVTETLDHGGMGWIYLARDLNVSERPCVLKGLIAHGDEVAAEAAEAERRYLAELSHHPNIVTIHNFVNYEGQGYIVMEYVGGRSLKEKWELHREEADEPLPVTDVISYLYAVLPAFGYMHARNRVYCDFKPDNVMHVEDEVKLIDLGAVRRFDDHDAPIYGTPSYQAPEVPRTGPTVASDLFTIGRTLAVLTLDWPGWKKVDSENRPVELLPDREKHPLLVEHDCVWRFLQRACAEDPADRFADADEMADQLYGVLCQVAATVEGRTKPYRSRRWSAPLPTLDPLDWRTLPRPTLPNLPHRTNRVAGTVEGDAAIQTVERLSDDDKLSWADCVVTALAYCERATLASPEKDGEDRERDLDRAAKLIEGLDPTSEDAAGHASVVGAARAYLGGIVASTRGESDTAVDCFDAAYAAAPGEAACALAYAAALERAAEQTYVEEGLAVLERGDGEVLPDEDGDETAALHHRAAGLYDQIVVAHPSWTGAVAGLTRALQGVARLRDAALAPLAVPESHPLRADALILACTYMTSRQNEGEQNRKPRFDDRIASAAVRYLDGTRPRNRPRSDAKLAATLYRSALTALQDGATIPGKVVRQAASYLATLAAPHDDAATAGKIAARPETEGATEDTLALAAEAALLELAEITPGPVRHALLDDAARIRPWTLR